MTDALSGSKILVWTGIGLAGAFVAKNVMWPSKRPKRVWLIRHGQAGHNVLFDEGKHAEARAFYDPPLTKKGFAQAREHCPVLETALGDDSNTCADLIVCSPLLRTLQTCTTMLGDFMGRHTNIPVILHPDIQEAGKTPNDTAHPKETVVSEYLDEFPTKVDFSLVTSTSHKKVGRYACSGEKLQIRYDDFLRWLVQREESRIIVVGHHNVFLFLAGISFINCEAREFDLLEQEPVPRLLPRNPKRTCSDNELDEKSLKHLRTFQGYVRKAEKQWGVKFPERLR